MVLTKTTCRICGAYPIFIDNESGEIWDDKDATESHLHQNPNYTFEEPEDTDQHRADDDGMGGLPSTFNTGGSNDDSSRFSFGGGGDFGGGGGGSSWGGGDSGPDFGDVSGGSSSTSD